MNQKMSVSIGLGLLLALGACGGDDDGGGGGGGGACGEGMCNDENRGVCVDLGDTFECACDPGYFLQGGACVSSDCEHTGSGTAYEVGPDQEYAELDEVPWESLEGGDTVMIHWREEPYRSKIGIRTEATEDQPLRVCGVPGEGGRPVLDGDGATTRPELESFFDPVYTEFLGLILIDGGADGDWMTSHPSYVSVEGLTVRGVREGNPYTTASGESAEYTDLSSGIWVQRGDHITIRNCELTDNNMGLFALSKDDGSPASITRELLIEGNHIHGNGIPGSDRRHSTYTAVAGIIFQFNHYEEEVDGAIGSALKDRSAGTIIRYNWIESGARTLDLVDPEDAPDTLSADARFHDTYVYGNVLLNRNGAARHMIHYGGDTGIEDIYRKGTLHFYNNTVYAVADNDEIWEMAMFELSTGDENVELRNNVFHIDGTSELDIMAEFGNAQLHPSNWLTNGWEPGQDGFSGDVEMVDGAPVTGADPGFADVAADDFSPGAGSDLIGGSAALGGGSADYPVIYQYVPHLGSKTREVSDLGALESE